MSLGYPGCEHQIRGALTEAIGEEKSDFFFDKVNRGRIIKTDQFLTFLLIVLGILLHRRRCPVFQEPWAELHSSALQLPPLRGSFKPYSSLFPS